jgi:hypothetical protein
MIRKTGFALAAGLALLVAGCAGQGGSAGTTSAGGPPQTMAPGATSVSQTSKNFNLAVKCPGVHWEKTHGWSNQQIMQQESLDEDDIPACEQWVQAQPKGYVPPAPGGGGGGGGGKTAPAPAGGTPPPGTAKQ